ncbi:Tex family protein [Desulfosediminicola ganghwensis]|uniref:Tex family protein n=1 Tax=Desulfosediminicola ganghwensis TaxID=2569540 RepID=UPI0010AD08EB|nr:Tex family protein [Desulfosediminicola ganghwensis]
MEPTTCVKTISTSLQLIPQNVQGVISLLEDGCTVPFIARYRKEATGSLDEVEITRIRDELHLFQEITKRRETILATIKSQGALTSELKDAITKAQSLSVLEDLYLPYRPKRRTRATIAREAGLEPLAESLYSKPQVPFSLERFLRSLEQEMSEESALAGARDIIAERISEHQQSRQALRRLFAEKAVIISKVVEKNREKAEKYRDYLDWQEPVKKIAGHRLLAMLRGENEKLLTLSLRPPPEDGIAALYPFHITKKTGRAEQVRLAIEDGYNRLLAPSLENELRKTLKEQADLEAIEVFAGNIKELLLASPLGQKRVLALDPGFRTGAKLVCLDGQGSLLESTTIFPTQSAKQQAAAAETVLRLVKKHQIEAIGVGSGTAGRETEEFIRGLSLPGDIIITMVNEDGASVYSASETARKEFPDLDLTVRGAISIGRRLQDPLAELVKIDPKAIGVGQYQHDVDQKALKQGLDDVVEYCVNSVGVEVNSASAELLTYVSGVGPMIATNIVEYRTQNGPFTTRKQLLKVPRLGPKAFEQCAGFVRVAASKNPLDRSAVHPERYPIVTQMAKDAGADVAQLMRSENLRKNIKLENYLTETIGLPTLKDIIAELARPGRDPRQAFISFSFAEGINTVDDLEPGMVLPAIITNVTKFGAFADIGVHQDGLIHISQLADRFVKDPADVVKTRQHVKVKVLEVDKERKRISLSLKNVVQ